jgi:hypothetical protein
MGASLVRLLALILALVISAASSAHAEKRVALVIGNATYKNAAVLQNPENDARSVAQTLKHLGFETIDDLDLDGMKDKSASFARAAHDAAAWSQHHPGFNRDQSTGRPQDGGSCCDLQRSKSIQAAW